MYSDRPVVASLVIPALNESRRIVEFLKTIREYFCSRGDSYQVLVIDDGSTDDTFSVVSDAFRDWEELRIIRHSQNMGKGAAVKTGVSNAAGAYVFYFDADGATPIAEIAKLRERLDAGADLVVGSRLSASGGRADRTVIRRILGWTFRQWAGICCHVGRDWDVQCGCKAFRRAMLSRIVASCREDQYLFDLEFVMRARGMGYRIDQVGIEWKEQPNGKLRLFTDSIRMAVGAARLSNRL